MRFEVSKPGRWASARSQTLEVTQRDKATSPPQSPAESSGPWPLPGLWWDLPAPSLGLEPACQPGICPAPAVEGSAPWPGQSLLAPSMKWVQPPHLPPWATVTHEGMSPDGHKWWPQGKDLINVSEDEDVTSQVPGLFNQQILIRGQTRNSGRALLGLMLQQERAKASNRCPCSISKEGKLVPKWGEGRGRPVGQARGEA